MTRARRAIAGLCAGAALLVAFPVAANATGDDPVRVDTNPDDDGYVGVFTGSDTMPLLSVWYEPATNTFCYNFSYEVPRCFGIDPLG